MSRIDEIRGRWPKGTKDDIDYLFEEIDRLRSCIEGRGVDQPRDTLTGAEVPCACKTFDVGEFRALLDGCGFLHTVVGCPEKPWTPSPTAGGERCTRCGHGEGVGADGFCQ